MINTLYDYQKRALAALPQGDAVLAWEMGCFAIGTRILMNDMTYKNIENVVSGDLVAVSDPRYHNLRPGKVILQQRTSNKPKPMIQFTYGKDKWHEKTITATYDHPFWDGERYYPLYEFLWRKMDTGQRFQLQLLCEQYGAYFNYSPSWGISHRDNPTSDRWFRPFANSDERTHDKSPSSCIPDMDTKSEKSTIYKSQRLQSRQQQDRKLGMVYSEAKQSTRLDKWPIVGISSKSSKGTNKIQPANTSKYMGMVGKKYWDHAYNRLAYQTKTIFGVRPNISSDTKIGSKEYCSEKIEIQKISIKKAEPYYSLEISGYAHTYIVETLPVHNTGKTRSALYEAAKRFPNVAVLVIAPASVVRAESWQREAKALGLEAPVVVSYETIRRRPATVEELSKSKFFLILDESHAIKVPTTKQARAVQKIRKGAVQTFLLSATPIPNGWKDWAGYSILLGHTKNWTEFREKYEIRKKAYFGNFYQTVGYKNIPALEREFEAIARHLSREDANELPDKQFISIPILPSPKYTQIARERILDGVALDNYPKLINALRQSTIDVRVPDLATILEGTNENIVVFYNYRLEADAIEKLAKSLKKTIFYANGDKHTLPAKEAWGSISNSVTIAQYQSASEGVEMTYAPICVYFSPTYSYKNYYQSQGRLHRNGQTKKCVFYEFSVIKTVDDDIWKAVRSKQTFDINLWAKENNFSESIF